jgi:uncharacterized protein YlxP (DUF503 family)
MVVGVCRVTFLLPGNASLKGKRSVVRRIVERTRGKFNAAVAEVDELDAHRRAVIGVSVVSNDARHANSMLDHICSFMSGISEAVLSQRSLEIIHSEGEPVPLPAADDVFAEHERDDDAP